MVVLLRNSLVGFLVCAWFLSRTYQPVLYFLLALCVSAWWCASHAPGMTDKESPKYEKIHTIPLGSQHLHHHVPDDCCNSWLRVLASGSGRGG